MSNSQKLMVLATIAIGLIPGFLLYRFFTTHPNILNLWSDESLTSTLANESQLASHNLVGKIYLSAPKKETSTLCPHSNYTSLILVLMKDGQFNLTKKCESNRDSTISWSGAASSTLIITDNTDNTDRLGLVVTGMHQYLIFTKKDTELVLIDTNIEDLATSTSFTLVNNSKPKDLNP